MSGARDDGARVSRLRQVPGPERIDALEAAQAKVDALYARWEELEAIDQAYQQSTS